MVPNYMMLVQKEKKERERERRQRVRRQGVGSVLAWGGIHRAAVEILQIQTGEFPSVGCDSKVPSVGLGSCTVLE